MKIAVMCTDLGVRIPGDKGASLHLSAIATAFERVGHDVLLLAVAGRGAPPDGLSTVLLPHPGRAEGLRREVNKLRFVQRFPAAVADAVAAFAPDIVYERLSLFGTAGIELAQRSGALHIVEVNALLAREEAQWRGLRLARAATAREAATLRHAALRVAVSDEWAAAVDGIAPGRTIVVPNGVDLDRFADLPSRSQARRRFALPADARLAAFVGVLRPWHGVDIALHALAQTTNDVHLVVAGDGPIRDELQRLEADLRIDSRVHWLGHVAHHDVPSVLAACDVAVAPYPALDGFAFSPLKLYEYLAAGVPIVASDIGQVRAALGDGAFGTLVPAGDSWAMAAAVSMIVAHPERFDAMAAAGRAFAIANHGWNQRAEAIITAARQAQRDALAA